MCANVPCPAVFISNQSRVERQPLNASFCWSLCEKREKVCFDWDVAGERRTEQWKMVTDTGRCYVAKMNRRIIFVCSLATCSAGDRRQAVVCFRCVANGNDDKIGITYANKLNTLKCRDERQSLLECGLPTLAASHLHFRFPKSRCAHPIFICESFGKHNFCKNLCSNLICLSSFGESFVSGNNGSASVRVYDECE